MSSEYDLTITPYEKPDPAPEKEPQPEPAKKQTRTSSKQKNATKTRKRRDMRRNPDLLPYEDAKAIVRGEGLSSRSAYHAWWEKEKPRGLPPHPNRTYEKFWTGWGDWLGVHNQFIGNKKPWVSYEEAALIAPTLGITGQQDWIAKAKAGLTPKTIPRRPDISYKEHWQGWGKFLGNKPLEALEVQQEAAKNAVFYIIHEKDTPGNVFVTGVDMRGLPSLKMMYDRHPYDIVRFYKHDIMQSQEVKDVITRMTGSYLGDDRLRLSTNIWSVVEYLDMILERITKLS